jgi:hypothetical protein
MRNTLSVLTLLAITALAAPTYAVEQDTGADTHIVATIDHADAFVADALVLTVTAEVPFALLDTPVELVGVAACPDCNSGQAVTYISGITTRPVLRRYKPHGHWLC